MKLRALTAIAAMSAVAVATTLARQAALWYSLIRPLRTCLGSIRAVVSIARPG
jgi:hypothetical protein